MGVENVDELKDGGDESKQKSTVERETDQEQRDRKDSEMQQVRRERQKRLGYVPASEEKKDEPKSETT